MGIDRAGPGRDNLVGESLGPNTLLGVLEGDSDPLGFPMTSRPLLLLEAVGEGVVAEEGEEEVEDDWE